MIEVVDVVTSRQARAFRDLPLQIYPPPSRWVAPLDLHVQLMMGPWRREDTRYWLALSDGRPVARLGARLRDGRVHVGFFECHLGWAEAAARLVEAARRMGGGRELRGPIQFGLEDPYAGCLVEGFEQDPLLLMPYNPPHYGEYLERAGLRPLMDLYSYEYRRGHVRLDVVARRAERAGRSGVRVRPMRRWRGRTQDLNTILALANQTHVQNWGFEPYIGELARDLLLVGRFVLDPRAVLLAFHEDRPVGFAIIVRDYNPLLKPSRGRLTPALLGRLATRASRLRGYRGYGMGILADSRGLDVASALVQAVIDASQEAAYQDWERLEIAWVVASNARMNALATALGGRRTRTHRLYHG